MTSNTAPFAIWQGFHHTWTYNHRLNRLGDWLEFETPDENTVKVQSAHAAASGSGEDKAAFTSFSAVTRAAGIRCTQHSLDGHLIDGTEEHPQAFVIPFSIAGVPPEHDVFAAVLRGFDLFSNKDADKLLSLHLATTPPVRHEQSGDVRFSLIGALNVDCDSPECDNFLGLGGLLAEIAAGVVVGATSPTGPIIGAFLGGFLGALPSLIAKLNLNTSYTFTAQIALLSGHHDHLAVTPHTVKNSVSWDKEDTVTLSDHGIRHRTLAGVDDPHWKASVPAITSLSIEVTRDRGFLQPDSAMHLLEWDMAIRPGAMTGTTCDAEFDLFFRNWRKAKSEFAPPPPLTHTDAGSALATMGVNLLQLAEPDNVTQDSFDGSIKWDGGNASADSRDAVRRQKPKASYTFPQREEEEPEWRSAVDVGPLIVAARNTL